MRSWKKLAGLSMMAAALLVPSVVGAAPVVADSGDMWVQPLNTPEETSAYSETRHLPCGPVDLWGDNLALTSGTWTLSHQAPPNLPAPIPSLRLARTHTRATSR